MDRSNRRPTIVFAMVLAACLILLVYIFNMFTNRYLDNVIYDSASHLIEINHQTKAYVEGVIKDDRNYTESMAQSIGMIGFSDEKDLLSYLAKMKESWGVDAIRIYASDGYCVDQDGTVLSRDDASRFAYGILKDGSSFQVIDSMMEYGVPLDDGFDLGGHTYVAISLVRDLGSLIDDMKLTSFDGAGYLYLTQSNGVKISQSTSGAPLVFNVSSLFSEGTMRCISTDGLSLDDAMAAGNESVFLFTGADGVSQYVVMTPIAADEGTWMLFYEVPELVVNAAMKGFSSYVVMLAGVVGGAFIALLIVFYLVYRARSRRYLADMKTREHLFDLLVSETGNAYLLLSRGGGDEGKVLYASSNIGKMLGTSSLKVCTKEGHLRIEALDHEEHGTVIDRIDEALAFWDGTGNFTSDYIPYGAQNDPRYLIVEIYPVQENGGELIGIVQDVTDVRRREEDIRSALVLADSANRAKTKFLSSMSHDIRTPMNAIVNMTRFAIDDADDPVKTRADLEVIRSSSDHLLKLINDVLDMSRIESGKFSLACDPLVLTEVLSGICEIIEPLCETKRQKFVRDWDSIEHPRIMGDALRLNQVLINLLNNAVKFTPEGGTITFRVQELRSLKADTAAFRFDVSDDGIGMDAETIKHIFEPFSRAESTTVKATEGSGLGLSITKSFVEAAGGSITVQSAPGKGSTFSVETFFPIDTSADEAATANPTDGKSTERFDGRRALLVEDNEINLAIAQVLLGEIGFSVETASNGKEAIDVFRAAGAGHFDVVYLDIQMPVMNGYEASMAIRSSGTSDAQGVAIIAMTANVFAEDIESARRAGMDGHIGKPIDPDDLRRETARVLALRPHRSMTVL